MNTEFRTTPPGGSLAISADTEIQLELPHFKSYGNPENAEVRIRVPSLIEVGKPAVVLMTTPDGCYLAKIETPSRGFDALDTSFVAALNSGRTQIDVFKFLGQLTEFTHFSIADCFRLYEKDMLRFVSEVMLRDVTILAEHDHEHETPASKDAFRSLREILRWICEELPAEYKARANIVRLEGELARSLKKYEELFKEARHVPVQRKPRQKKGWEF